MSKQDKQFNLKLIKHYNIFKLKSLVEEFSSEWEEDESRQTGTKHHWRTQAYHIMWYPIGWLPGDKYVPSFLCKRDDVWQEIESILKDLGSEYDGKPARVTLVKLPKGKLVTPHRDKSIYTDVINRFHIPIITNDEVYFSVDDETVNMKIGECWEVNNAKLHGAYNLGDTDRVHLMIDIISNGLFGDKEYTGYPG